MYKVLVTGDRNWQDKEIVLEHVRSASEKAWTSILFIHGDAAGADRACEEACHKLHLPRIVCPADWDRYKKSAGPVRNRFMLKLEPSVIWAYHDDLSNSRGTMDMVSIALKKGILVKHYSHIEEKEYRTLDDLQS